MLYKLNLRPGNLSTKVWQGFASDLYAAVVEKKIENIGEAIDTMLALDQGARFDLMTPDRNDPVLSSGGKIMGTEIPITLVIDLTPAELIFQLNRYATGVNGDIIAHLVSIDGKLKLYRPFDPRILKACNKDITKVHGVDIISFSSKEAGIGIKNFLDNKLCHAIASIDEPLFGVNPEAIDGLGYWLALKLIIDKTHRKYPEYTLADLVRVTVGDNPRDLDVDNTAP